MGNKYCPQYSIDYVSKQDNSLGIIGFCLSNNCSRTRRLTRTELEPISYIWQALKLRLDVSFLTSVCLIN